MNLVFTLDNLSIRVLLLAEFGAIVMIMNAVREVVGFGRVVVVLVYHVITDLSGYLCNLFHLFNRIF